METLNHTIALRVKASGCRDRQTFAQKEEGNCDPLSDVRMKGKP